MDLAAQELISRRDFLKPFYDRREESMMEDYELSEFPKGHTEQQVRAQCQRLKETELIDWRPHFGPGPLGQGRIKIEGINFYVGLAENLPSSVINISHSTISGSQVGTSHSSIQNLTLSQLKDAIERSAASPEDKDEAKSRLQKFLEHPLTTSIAGGLAGAAGGLVSKQ